MTTKEQVLSHLRSGRTLTPLDALKMFNTMSLAEIVHSLRHEENIDVKTTIMYSGKKHFASYSIEPKESLF